MARARSSPLDDGIVVVGAKAHPIRDAYHSMLRMPLMGVLATIAALLVALNAAFGLLYMLSGGVAGMHDGSFSDAFFFSVQTMGTVGYGAMYPASMTANLIATMETIVGIIVAALVTGVVFARFSQASASLVFTSRACISPMEGVPTLILRVGNERESTIVEATITVVMTKTAKTKEGVVFYRMVDLTLTRSRTLALSRSWTVLHVIDETSPLYGYTPERCRAEEVEITAAVTGTDDTSLQPVHARLRYEAKDIVWGARPADVLSDLPDGRLQLDVRRFDEITSTQPTETFPYPKAG